MAESSNPPGFGNAPLGAAGALSSLDFPNETFECPHCGQLLAPSCRVCVSCKQPIDPDQIKRARADSLAAALPVLEPERPAVQFPWRVFFAVLAVSWLASTLALRFLGLLDGQMAVLGLQFVSTVWVFGDARRKMIPKPLRWAVGALVLWVVMFPWYLVRRKKLQAPCPFVEVESGPFTRVMVLVVFIFFLVAVIFSALNGPAPK